MYPDAVAPGSHTIGTMTAVAVLAFKSIKDPRAKHDIALHMARVFHQYAEIFRREAQGATLPLRKPGSGEFRAATGILQEAASDNTLTKKSNVTALLAAQDEDTKP